MKPFLDFNEANQILEPYYLVIRDVIKQSFDDTNEIKEFFASKGLFLHQKPRSKGSTINDVLKTRFSTIFSEDKNVSVIDNGVVGLLIHNKIFIRFNKMNDNFSLSVQKTKSLKNYYKQGENKIDGISEDVTILFGGFVTDKAWAELKGYFLTCYNDSLVWYYDLNKTVIQQTAIDFAEKPQEQKKRLSTKKKPKDDQTGTDGVVKTGTGN